MSALLVAGIPGGDCVIELLDDLPHRGDSTTIALIVGSRNFRLRLPQQACQLGLRFGPAFGMSEKITQSLVVLVVRHDPRREESAGPLPGGGRRRTALRQGRLRQAVADQARHGMTGENS
jgi:hypothetical protein